MVKLTAGSDIDAYCGKCKLVLAHVIIALKGARPARVQCKTCNAEHNYKKTAPRQGTTRRSTAKSDSASKQAAFDSLVAGRDLSRAVRYGIGETFVEEDVLDHKTFGLGLVTRVLSDNKIEVQFSMGSKILVHAR